MSFCRRSSCSVCQPCWRTASLQLQASQQLFHAGSIASVWAPSAILCDSHEGGHCSAWRQSLPSCCSRAFSGERFTGGGEEAAARAMGQTLSFGFRVPASPTPSRKRVPCTHTTHTHIINRVSQDLVTRIFFAGDVCAGAEKRDSLLNNAKKTYGIKERRRLATGERPTYKTAAKH